MSRYRCLSCRGEYSDPQQDGSSYFHVCPPLVDPDTGEARPRPDHRDETVRTEGAAEVERREGALVHRRLIVAPRAAGRGRELLPDAGEGG